uniref:Uncharacterized protein n=1 Tax=Cacopsylla melanoneura TaxID=428564 RepID=A0A8D8VSQ3_9HEMI
MCFLNICSHALSIWQGLHLSGSLVNVALYMSAICRNEVMLKFLRWGKKTLFGLKGLVAFHFHHENDTYCMDFKPLLFNLGILYFTVLKICCFINEKTVVLHNNHFSNSCVKL